MTHPIGKWHGDMSAEEAEWFRKCPKAVLFEISRSLAMRLSEDCPGDAFHLLKQEWAILNGNGIVPQKPFNPAYDDGRQKGLDRQAKAEAKMVYWAKDVIGDQQREE